MNAPHHCSAASATGASQRIVVTGGTGKVGRRVARRLADAGHHVLAVGRSTTPSLDWGRPATFARVVDGADAAFVSFAPDIAFPGAAAAVAAFADRAVAAGVRRFVVLSGRGEPAAEPAEQAVRDAAATAGARCTVLRCAWFAQNLSEGFLLRDVLDGVIALPAATVAEPFVDIDDVAEVAVAALLGAEWDGGTLDVTGPELLSFGQVAELLNGVLGRPVTYLPVGVTEYVDAAVAAGLPRDEAEPLGELFARVLDGHNSSVSPDLANVLGRPPGGLAAFVERTAATGVWDVPARTCVGGGS